MTGQKPIKQRRLKSFQENIGINFPGCCGWIVNTKRIGLLKEIPD